MGQHRQEIVAIGDRCRFFDHDPRQRQRFFLLASSGKNIDLNV